MGLGFRVKQREGGAVWGFGKRNGDGWKGHKRRVTWALGMYRVAGA